MGTFRDKILFLWRTDRKVIRISAVAVALSTFGFAPIQEDLLTYMTLRYCSENTTNVITLSTTGILGMISCTAVAPWAKRRYGIKKTSMIGFAMSGVLLASVGVAWEVWMIFVSLIWTVGAFISFPLVTALVSQAASGAEQGIVTGAFTSVNALAQGFSPILFGSIFYRVQHWYEDGNGGQECICGAGTG